MNQSPFIYIVKIAGLFLLFLVLFHVQTILFNHEHFSFSGLAIIQALRYDFSLTAYAVLPFIPIALLASFVNPNKVKMLIKTLAIIEFLCFLLPESWDLIYINYTGKRASFEVYTFYLLGRDNDQFLSLFGRFWFVVVSIISWFGLFLFLIKKSGAINLITDSHLRGISKSLVLGIIAFLVARNNLGPKPLGVADALVTQDPFEAQLILNSPFVVLKTIQNNPLPAAAWISREQEGKLVNPKLTLSNEHVEKRWNLMFIIVESLGTKQLNKTIKHIPITPFLDSLAKIQTNECGMHGLAEGKTSIECLPAMFAGVPSLLETPFTLSNFSTNQLTGFPRICQQKGYQTYFVHGAQKGSMRFDAMANSLGFSHQWFENSLPSKISDRGSWGVHDHAVFKHLSKKIPALKEPFMMTVFTLSTHEPYDIPRDFKQLYPALPNEACSYRFMDEQLRKFFETNSGKAWFNNTLFVISGDHTPVHLDNARYHTEDYFAVPLLIVPPKGTNQRFSVKEQQALVPELCKAMGWETQLYSYYKRQNKDHIRYLNGVYYVWNTEYEIQFNETNMQWRVITKSLKNSSRSDKKLLNLKIEASKTKLLSLLQRFRRDLRLNRTHR